MFLNNCIKNCLSINTLVCEYEDSSSSINFSSYNGSKCNSLDELREKLNPFGMI